MGIAYLIENVNNWGKNFYSLNPVRLMSAIGVLAASVATLFNLDYLPERLLIGDIDTVLVPSSLSVVCSGRQLMSVTNAARISALGKFDQGAFSATVGLTPNWLRLAPTRVNKACTINITNSGVATPTVYASSTAKGNIARTAVEQTINASANQTFTEFEALFFLPTNLLRVNLTFADGFNDDYSPAEVDALFASASVADDDGRLEGLSVIRSDRPGNNDIVQAVIYTTSGGNMTVLKTSYVVL
jgi:hypothetical protein